MDFRDKIVLITGASSGIGAATSKEFARLGAKVLLLARSEDNLKKVADEIKKEGGYAKYYTIDISDHKSVDKISKKIKKDIGVPDIIFNNAGSGPFKFIEETSPDEVFALMTPYFGAFFITRSFMTEMLKRNSGHIVNMSSNSYVLSFPGVTGYIAANAAMRGFNDALRSDLYATNIRVTIIACSKVNTTFWANNPTCEQRCPTAQELLPTPNADEAAKTIVKGVYKKKKVIYIPSLLRIAVFIRYLCPPFMHWLLYKTGYKRENIAHLM